MDKGRSGMIARPIRSRISFYCNSRSSRRHQVLSYHVVSLASLQAYISRSRRDSLDFDRYITFFD